MNKYAVMNTVFSVIGGAVIGGTIAILTTKKHYELYAEEEIEKVRTYYALIRKEDGTVQIFGEAQKPVDPEKEKLETELANANQLIKDLGYDDNEEAAIESARTRNIFNERVDPSEVGPELTGPNGTPIATPEVRVSVDVTIPENMTDPNDPLAGYERISGEPYIISQDEMFNTETEWAKPSLSYYVGDDTLIDEREAVLDGSFRTKYVGERHLHMFGVISEDENIVYVRSPQISTDFEIIKEPGKYSVRVLGEPDYEAAEHQQELRRMRERDQ